MSCEGEEINVVSCSDKDNAPGATNECIHLRHPSSVFPRQISDRVMGRLVIVNPGGETKNRERKCPDTKNSPLDVLQSFEKGNNLRTQQMNIEKRGNFEDDGSNSTLPSFQKLITYDKYECKSTLGDELPSLKNCRSYSCSKCNKSFKEKRLYTRHLRAHMLRKPYPCTECDYSFIDNHGLFLHQRTHTLVKPFKCTECMKRFTRKAALLEHQRTHTGEKPHQCTECERAFRTKRDLLVHHRTHTGERPYHCTECERSFSRKDTLHKHERIHTKETPYQCNQCKQSFSRREALKTHQKAHMLGMLKETPYQCT